jgi:hypothetical protein
MPVLNTILHHRDMRCRAALILKESGVHNIFVSDVAKAKITNDKAAYERSKKQKTTPQLTYYTRSYSMTSRGDIEHGPGFILSFIEDARNTEGYAIVHVESEFPVLIGPSGIFDLGTHFIDWDNGKFKLNSVRN